MLFDQNYSFRVQHPLAVAAGSEFAARNKRAELANADPINQSAFESIRQYLIDLIPAFARRAASHNQLRSLLIQRADLCCKQGLPDNPDYMICLSLEIGAFIVRLLDERPELPPSRTTAKIVHINSNNTGTVEDRLRLTYDIYAEILMDGLRPDFAEACETQIPGLVYEVCAGWDWKRPSPPEPPDEWIEWKVGEHTDTVTSQFKGWFLDTLNPRIEHWSNRIPAALVRAQNGLALPEVRSGTSASQPPTNPESGGRRGIRESFVKPILAAKGWSILDWATNSGLDCHTTNDYLKGITNPYPSTRKKLADSLEVLVWDLPE